MPSPLRFFATGPDRPALQDPARVDAAYRRHRAAVLVTITLSYGFLYTCRIGLSVIKQPTIDAGIFNATELGLISSALFYAYALGKFTNGFLADHANIKRFYSFAMLVTAGLNLIMGHTKAVWLCAVLWGVNGWFQGFGSPSCVVALSQWFSNRERGRYYGIYSTGHPVGEGLTFVGSAYLVHALGWQYGFIGPGLACLAVAAGMYALLQDRPPTLGLPTIADYKDDHGAALTDARGAPVSGVRAQLAIFRLPAIWILALASCAMYVTRYAINSWGMLYLQKARGYSLMQAGSMLGVLTVSGIAGSVAYGFISDKLFAARRPPVNLIYGLFEIAALVVIYLTPPGHPAVLTGAFVVYGFALNGLVASIGGLFAVDIVPKRATGAVMGFIGIFSYLGAATQDILSGYLLDRDATVQTLASGAQEKVFDFSAPFLFWIGASVVSCLLAASLWRVKVRD